MNHQIQKTNQLPKINASYNDHLGNHWIADGINGLVKFRDNKFESIIPNGPKGESVQRLFSFNNTIYVAPGEVGTGFSNSFIKQGVSYFQDNFWEVYYDQIDSLNDILAVQASADGRRLYVGSFHNGLAVFENGVLQTVYNKSNSTLQGNVGYEVSVRVSALTRDRQGNIWVANYGTPTPIHRLTPEGEWTAFNIPALGNGAVNITNLMMDQSGTLWGIIRNGGIFAFRVNDDETTNFKRYTASEGSGNLGTNTVLSLAQDLDGRIWVGTAEGIRVLFTPFDAFSNSPADAQPIRIVQDGLVQFLLETDQVTAIAVDGANQKWVGTNNGLWLFSEDGTRAEHYFTERNSPLFSNKVETIAIQPESGEVFIGTDKGIISYRAKATQGEIIHSNVEVFQTP